MRDIILDGIAMRLQMEKAPQKQRGRFRIPVIKSKNPGSLRLGEEGVYEYIPFP
jgi:hypothetical protein